MKKWSIKFVIPPSQNMELICEAVNAFSAMAEAGMDLMDRYPKIYVYGLMQATATAPVGIREIEPTILSGGIAIEKGWI